MLLNDCKTITGRAVKETEEQSEFVVARPSKLSRIFFLLLFSNTFLSSLLRYKVFTDGKLNRIIQLYSSKKKQKIATRLPSSHPIPYGHRLLDPTLFIDDLDPSPSLSHREHNFPKP